MEGLPDTMVPGVVSLLETKDLHRCACIAKEWAYLVHQRKAAIKETATRQRAQLTEEQKLSLDKELYKLVEGGHAQNLEELLLAGADANGQHTWNRYTCLHSAAARGYFDIIELLLAWGVSVDAKNSGGATALMLASGNGHVAIAETLIAHGAAIEARNHYGSTALIWAYKNDQAEVAKALLRLGADENLKPRYA